jgi:aspartyl-tRNA(Asn)/glutamyl-tRNA(Gln) amidotransferase subunit A
MIHDLSLTEVTQAISTRELSSVEITGACLDRFTDYGRALVCITRFDPDMALRDAAAADAEIANGTIRGPLHGVPLAHKDMFYREGHVSGCGSRIRANYVADRTSTALARLDAAGALDIARLNMVEFAVGGVGGHNSITGTPRNPWNMEYIPGGSSSGAAVAVASRQTFGSLGSDTGGSIRIPATCCGVVGLQPTYGRVSRYGAMPLSFSLDQVGVLTRTVPDAALMLSVIAGHDELDATSSRRPVPNYLATLNSGVKGLRIAVAETYFQEFVDEEVRSQLEESLDVFRSCGAQIVPVTLPPSFELAGRMGALILAAEGAAIHSKWLRECPDDYGPQARARLMTGLKIPATRYIEALNLRACVFDEFSVAVFENADVLHVPTIPMCVPRITDTDRGDDPDFMAFVNRITRCTRPFNYLGLPAVAVPAGLDARGLPLGFQLVARPFDEATLLRTARAYERETPPMGTAPLP